MIQIRLALIGCRCGLPPSTLPWAKLLRPFRPMTPQAPPVLSNEDAKEQVAEESPDAFVAAAWTLQPWEAAPELFTPAPSVWLSFQSEAKFRWEQWTPGYAEQRRTAVLLPAAQPVPWVPAVQGKLPL